MTDQTPSKRRYQKTRQGILDAASAIIIENGVEALSMRALAEKVDYSASALYKYFENKDEIIAALREEGERISAAITQGRIKPEMGVKDAMLQMGLGYLEFARRYPAHYQLIMSPTEIVPNALDEFVNDPRFSGLISFSENAIASREIKLPDGAQPVHLAFLMWFVGHGAAMIQNNTMKNCLDDYERLYAQVLDMMIGLI